MEPQRSNQEEALRDLAGVHRFLSKMELSSEVVPQLGNQEKPLRDLTGVRKRAGPFQNGALICQACRGPLSSRLSGLKGSPTGGRSASNQPADHSA